MACKSASSVQEFCMDDFYRALLARDATLVRAIISSGMSANHIFDFLSSEQEAGRESSASGSEAACTDHMSEVVVPAEVAAHACLPNRPEDSKELHSGYAAVHISSMHGSEDVLRALLDCGGDVNLLAASGESPLHIACKFGHAGCVQILTERGANVDLQHDEIGGDTPLLTTVASYTPYTATDYLTIAKILISKGCDVDLPDGVGLAPIHVAVTKSDTKLTELLIEAGADLNVKTNHVDTPLVKAIDFGSIDNVSLLLSTNKVDVNGVVTLGNTALLTAVLNNNLVAVMELLKYGARSNVGPPDSCPLSWSAAHRQVLFLLLMLLNGGNINATNSFDHASLLLTLTRKNSVSGVNMLMQLGVDPDLENKLGSTALWAAVKDNNFRLVHKLVSYNCNLDIPSLEHFIYKPIMPVQLAIELYHFPVAKFLLTAGCQLKRHWIFAGRKPASLKENHHIETFLMWWVSNPRSLKHLCRRAVRQCLGWNPADKLKTVQFPRKLKNFILFKYT